MHHAAHGRAEPRRRPWPLLLGLALAVAVVVGVLGGQSASSLARSFGLPRLVDPGGVGEADGLMPDGTTVFDDVPGVVNLEGDLLTALRRAATDAARGGTVLRVDSGWRSPAYQEQLLRDAVAEYGSEAEAARWVATPATSAHVQGEAVDIGPVGAAAWLSRHGAGYGLCQIYRNEPWHFELRPRASADGCPRMYSDPAHDPRMR